MTSPGSLVRSDAFLHSAGNLWSPLMRTARSPDWLENTSAAYLNTSRDLIVLDWEILLTPRPRSSASDRGAAFEARDRETSRQVGMGRINANTQLLRTVCKRDSPLSRNR